MYEKHKNIFNTCCLHKRKCKTHLGILTININITFVLVFLKVSIASKDARAHFFFAIEETCILIADVLTGAGAEVVVIVVGSCIFTATGGNGLVGIGFVGASEFNVCSIFF